VSEDLQSGRIDGAGDVVTGGDERGPTYWLLTFDRQGPARYLSHLDTARALQRTFARAGIALALTEGFRPKPRFALGLPLPVGAAGLDEVAVAQIARETEDRGVHEGEPRLGAALAALRATAPEGLTPRTLTATDRRPRLRPRRADYECDLRLDAAAAARAVDWFAAQQSVEIERRSPKGRRTLDLKQFVIDLAATAAPGGTHVSFCVRHRADGAARPQEVADLLATRAGGEPVMYRLIRTRVSYEGLPRDMERGGEE
jgi:radical SAM-linked protein